jgi:hypothetical protein
MNSSHERMGTACFVRVVQMASTLEKWWLTERYTRMFPPKPQDVERLQISFGLVELQTPEIDNRRTLLIRLRSSFAALAPIRADFLGHFTELYVLGSTTRRCVTYQS